ncbi:MAG: STAS domain-containing protein [Chloroflexota bacterium]
MAATKIEVGVRHLGEGVSVLDVRGDINAQAESTLMDGYNAATGMGARAVILNLSGLEYMNSGGIGLLVTMLIRANRQSQRLLAYGISDHYRQIFELTRLNEAIGLHGSEAEAFRAAKTPPPPGTLNRVVA